MKEYELSSPSISPTNGHHLRRLEDRLIPSSSFKSAVPGLEVLRVDQSMVSISLIIAKMGKADKGELHGRRG